MPLINIAETSHGDKRIKVLKLHKEVVEFIEEAVSMYSKVGDRIYSEEINQGESLLKKLRGE